MMGVQAAPVVDEAAVLRKLNRHILVKFFAMTVLCYIDRTNLAFAALQLNRSLGFTEYVYGVGSGIFFVGYSLFMVRWHMHSLRPVRRLFLHATHRFTTCCSTVRSTLLREGNMHTMALRDAKTLSRTSLILRQRHRCPAVAVDGRKCVSVIVVGLGCGSHRNSRWRRRCPAKRCWCTWPRKLWVENLTGIARRCPATWCWCAWARRRGWARSWCPGAWWPPRLRACAASPTSTCCASCWA